MKRIFILSFLVLFCFSATSSFAGDVYEIVSQKGWKIKSTRYSASIRGGVEVFGWMTGEKAEIIDGEGSVNILALEKAILSSPLLIDGKEIVGKGATLVNNTIDTKELGTIKIYYRARKKTVMVFLTKKQLEDLGAFISQTKSAE